MTSPRQDGLPEQNIQAEQNDIEFEAVSPQTEQDEAELDIVPPQAEQFAAEPRRGRGRSLDLLAHSVEQNIWILALPLCAERLLQSLVDSADMAMVGRVGASAVAAVGLSNQISMIATGVFDAIRVGTTSVVARRVGAGRYDEAQQALRQSLIVASIIGVISFLMFSVFAGDCLRLMGAEADVISMGIGYFWWKGLSLVFEYMTMTFAAGLRGSGDTRLPMWVGLVMNGLNLAGNYVLIGGHYGFPQLNATGAGVATAVARFVGMLMIVMITTTRPNPLRNWLKGSFKPDREALGAVLRVGVPASGERLTLRGAQLLYTRAVAGLGTAAYAAHQIALRTESISLVMGFSFGATATTLVGQYLGADDHRNAEKAARRSQQIASLAMGVAGVLLFLFAPVIVRLFIPDNPEVVALGASVVRIVAIAQPFMAVNHVLAGSLRGAGDTAWVMYITGFSAWAVRVVLTYLLVNNFGLHLQGAWYAMVLDLVFRSMLFRWRFGTGKWKEIRV